MGSRDKRGSRTGGLWGAILPPSSQGISTCQGRGNQPAGECHCFLPQTVLLFGGRVAFLRPCGPWHSVLCWLAISGQGCR